MSLLSQAELRDLARELAPLVAAELKHVAPVTTEYIEGWQNIARFVGVSAMTIRSRVKAKKIPVCGYKEYHRKGKLRMAPRCRIADLRASMEGISVRKSA